MIIVVADDEDLIRRALERSLSSRGHTVFVARHGNEALAHLEQTPSVDLLILDLLMPEKNGFEVLQAMSKTIPVIVISAFTGTTSEGLTSTEYPQIIGFLKKPFPELSQTLRSIEELYENYRRKV
jgi:two-component system, OmpR family, response regulator VanR